MTAKEPPRVGTAVTVTCPVENRLGALTDPDTITFETKSGVTATPTAVTFDVVGGTGDPTGTIVRLSLGTFDATFIGTEHGVWECGWKTTGAVVLVKETSILFQPSSFSAA